MVTTDNAGAWARQRAEQIQREDGERTAKMRQLNQEIEALEASAIPLQQKLFRAQRFDPSLGICPRCFIDDGVRSELKPIPIGAIVVEGAQRDVDLMRCPNRDCGWDDTVTQ
jgi:hypothetical protein